MLHGLYKADKILADKCPNAVAVIADRTAEEVRYTGKLSNQFWLQVDERLIERTETQSIQARLTKVYEVS